MTSPVCWWFLKIKKINLASQLAVGQAIKLTKKHGPDMPTRKLRKVTGL
jgi:hypothetical protein